ncbi:MAG: ubiquitin-like domain-containing protein [Anaerolineales bacterium]|jgi:uncharacterized protein YabE (DUF348 family)
MKVRLLETLPRQWINLLSLALTLIGLAFVYSFTAKNVLLAIDGENQQIRTHARDVKGLFRDLELGIAAQDRVSVPLDDPVVDRMYIEINRAKSVSIESAGESGVVQSASRSPVNILADGGIRIFPGDQIWVDGIQRVHAYETSNEVPESIRLDSAQPFKVSLDGSEYKFRSSADTVGLALLDAGVTLFEGDRISPSAGKAMEPGIHITVTRARPLIVQLADRELPVQSAGETVGEVLIDAGISVSGMDYTIPELEAPVPADGQVRVVHVEEDVLVELEPLPFETAYQPLETLELDQLQVQNVGTYGVQAERVRIRYEDGEEVDRSVEEAVTVVEPEPRVIGYGTKIVVRTLNTGSGTIEYWRAVPVYATSYSPCRLGVDRCGFTTAAGTSVDRGTIGVIRSWFNQMRGWPVYVPGYGPGSIQDIGAGFSDRDWIDLGFTDEEYEAWHDWTTLYFLTPVPPLNQIPWILP